MRNRLNIYIMTLLCMATAFATAALVGMFWLGQSVPLIEQVILRGEGTATFFRLSVMLFPKIIKLLLPIAILIGVVFTMNRLATEGELMAIHNSGQNPLKLLIPLGVFGFFMFVIHFMVTIWLAPLSQLSLNTQLHDIRTNFAKNIVTARTFVKPENGLYIYADKSTLDGEMLDIFIDDRREAGYIRNYFAKRALLVREGEVAKIALLQGEYHEQEIKTQQISVGSFDRFEVLLDNENMIQRPYTPNLEQAPIELLFKDNATWQENGYREQKLNEQYGELADRLSFPLITLIMPMIAALGFLSAPWSRHGYSHIIIPTIIIGLLTEAYAFSMKGVITGGPQLLWIVALPLIIFVLYMLFYSRRIHGGRR